VLEDDRVRAVVIATPTPTHSRLVQRAAAAGKHIFCEKPLALDVQQTIKAAHAAEAAGVLLQIGFHIRHDPQYSLVQSEAAAGELGEVVLFHARLRDMQPPDPRYLQDCGSVLLDGAIHLFDLAQWLVGAIEQVTAVCTRPIATAEPVRAGESCAVVLKFAGGALGMVENTRCCRYGFDCIAELVGTRTARLGEHHRRQIEWLEAGRQSVDLVRDFTERFPHAYANELASFVDSVHRCRPVSPTGTDAILAASIAHAAERSLREGRTIQVSP
jgi:myo-inositol 2-dehydrogenase/D-chiro-inositol 1-dehydrogenase